MVGPVSGQRKKIEGKEPLFKSSQCISGNCESGTGSARNDNGDLYYGTWVNGRPHGLGTIYFDLENEDYSPGTFFTGRFAYGLVDGMGTFDFPGEKRMTVKFDKSRDLAVFQSVGKARPRKRRHVLDDVQQWGGWEIRQRTFFETGTPDRIMVDIYKDWDGASCWSTTARSGPVEIFFLIDTGCSGTALTKSTLNFLRNKGIRVTETGAAFYNTACGRVPFREYTIESLTVGGVTFNDLKVSEVEGDTNLLGMNVLSSFGTFEFNTEHRTLVLE
jgi:hypothetical protein